MFKASDYRISPFELESVLIEHPAVAEAAVVPAPDEVRLAVPKAYVVLVAGQRAEPGTRRRHPARTAASTSRRTSGSGGSSSPTCRRRSAARSAGSSCAARRSEHAGTRPDGEYREEDFADRGPEVSREPLLRRRPRQQDEPSAACTCRSGDGGRSAGIPPDAEEHDLGRQHSSAADKRPAGNRWGPCTRRCCCCRRAAGSSSCTNLTDEHRLVDGCGEPDRAARPPHRRPSPLRTATGWPAR